MQTTRTPITPALDASRPQNVPQTPANGHSGKTPSATAAKASRTVAQARAERAARAARPVPVSDKHADALLRDIAPDAEYPALSSRTLARRELHDAGVRDTFNGNGGQSHHHNDGNVNDANFNRAATPSSLSRAALNDLASADMDALLDALDLDAGTRQMLLLRMEGRTLQEIAGRMGIANRQTVDRRIKEVGMKLFAHYLSDPSCGFESVLRTETHKNIVHSLSGGRPAVSGGVCDCASHQFRVQRAKGQASAPTYHCEHCRKKYAEGEFRALMNA